jgi:hypothetical protein
MLTFSGLIVQPLTLISAIVFTPSCAASTTPVF